MALYEYLCPACRKGFELMRPMSDAHRDAVCPSCGCEAQRIISGSLSARDPTRALPGPSGGYSEAGTGASEVLAANLRIAMIPAFDFEHRPARYVGPPERVLGEDRDDRPSAGSAIVSAPTAVREGAAANPEIDLEEVTSPLEMPWLNESQPGGGNLWYIRDWGIASMFGYLRDKLATEAIGKLTSPVAVTDAKPSESEAYRQAPGQQGATLDEPRADSDLGEGAGSHPSFSEWRNAVSLMPWLLDTGLDSPEGDKEALDVVVEDYDMPGLRPPRNRAAAHLSWARWPHTRAVEERAADLAKRSRPAREEKSEDFPGDVVDAAWRRQGGRCAACGRWLVREHRNRDCGTGAWESHYRIPPDQGGDRLVANCVLFCSGAADCHFNVGHGGIEWAHCAPLDESALLFLSAGGTTATAPATPVRSKRNLLREVFGIPQVRRDEGKPHDESGRRDSAE